ncbi:MAG: hypothetical protein IJY03_02720 [Prevotella sp.]|nr:hypothetical protein [Prevotella sp.]
MANEFIGLGGNTDNVTVNDETRTVEIPVTDNVEERQPTPPSEIEVHVEDQTAPIILLFGATTSGKSMTLVRLAKYLRKKNYRITVDMNFCTNAWEYKENARRFNDMLGTTRALKGTDRNDFLFIKIEDSRGTTVCQILEGAGEDYFPSKSIEGFNRSNIPFPPYMATVFGGDNKKIWAFLTEPDWAVPHNDKLEYVERIRYCKQQHTGGRDKFIILYNKVDKRGFAIDKTSVHTKNAIKACSNEYSGLFEIFRNNSPLPWSRDYLCEFVPFSTGIYGLHAPGELAPYTPSNDVHPATLWATILKCIKG